MLYMYVCVFVCVGSGTGMPDRMLGREIQKTVYSLKKKNTLRWLTNMDTQQILKVLP